MHMKESGEKEGRKDTGPPLSFLSRIHHRFTVVSCCDIYRYPRYWIEGSSSRMTASCYPRQAPPANLKLAGESQRGRHDRRLRIVSRGRLDRRCTLLGGSSGALFVLRVFNWRGGTSLARRRGPARIQQRSLSLSLSLLSSGYAPDRRDRQGAGDVRNCDRSLRC